jgi:DNA (cytosine-5)-methyltransferase 1
MPETVIDLFCGVGGLTHGFVNEGFQVVAGIDIDTSCRFAFEVNNAGAKFIGKPLEDITSDELAVLYPDGHTRILVGCAPCQPFSSANTRQKKGKWYLVETFVDRIETLTPDVISMENVLRLKTFEGGHVFRAFVERLEKLGYEVTHFAVNAADYGVAQRRHRLVAFASRFGPVRLVAPSHGNGTQNRYLSVRNAIGQLREIKAGIENTEDRLHRASSLSAKNLERIQVSTPGGSWTQWDEDLRADCHKREQGSKSPSVYGRMQWDDIAPTITTQFNNFGSGRYGHPVQHRALSLREGAILQSFPANYEFIPPNGVVNVKQLARHIGNAVPVALGRAIARSIRVHLGEYQEAHQR